MGQRLTAQKTLFCPRCEKFPDEIIDRFTVVERVEERLVWNPIVGRYEIVESSLDGEECFSYCGECGTELEEIPDEDTSFIYYS